MRGVRQCATMLSAVTLIACETRSEATPVSPVPARADFARAAVDQRVTDNATILLPNFGDALERFSVSAVRHNDGTVSGQFEETSEQEGGQRIHADVVCFTVEGNTARLSARITQTNVSFGPVGSYVVWSVMDNGEGAKSLPDQTTDVFFGGTEAQAEFHCRVGFNLAPFYPSIRGNLRVQ